MPENEAKGDGGGLSRREILKRGAIAGSVFWAVPVIQTIAAPSAHAQGSPPGVGACCECKAPAPPFNVTCSVDDPSCDTCVNLLCGGAANFSRYFVGDGCGCTDTPPKKCIPATRCVQQTCG
jgi:hypothetical protein